MSLATDTMNIDWLPIFLSAIVSGLLSLVISHIYYRITLRSAQAHHEHQLSAAAARHAQQMAQMENHHAEHVLVLRTTLLAVEKDSGVEAARDVEGNLTGGVHHEGKFTAVPGVASSAIAETARPAGTDREANAEAISRESASYEAAMSKHARRQDSE
jgi:hypothetical protein